MTCWIRKDSFDRDTIFTNSAEVGADVQHQELHADHLYARLSDGRVFTYGKPLSNLAPFVAEMAAHYLAEKGMPKPVIFVGEPVVEDDEAEAVG